MYELYHPFGTEMERIHHLHRLRKGEMPDTFDEKGQIQVSISILYMCFIYDCFYYFWEISVLIKFLVTTNNHFQQRKNVQNILNQPLLCLSFAITGMHTRDHIFKFYYFEKLAPFY